MKSNRQNAIIELIEKFEIETQEDMISRLRALGYEVTQATVSRDIKELGLQKVKGSLLKTKYAVAPTVYTSEVTNDKIIILLKNFIVSVESAKNLVIVKTIAGNGSACGMAIDKLKMQGVVGSIAGDDTLLLVTHEDEVANNVVKEIKSLINI